MTVNIQAMIDQAFDAGREAERKMASIAARGGAESLVLVGSTTLPSNVARKWRGTKHVTAFVKHEDKAPVAAKAAKKAGTRVSGVKQGIMDLISTNAMTAQDIISKTGFKGTSVRGTLMTLKKNGLAMNDDGLWIAAASHDSGGNSESASADF